MDWKPAARLFEISHQLVRRRILVWVAAVIILSPTLLTHLFLWRIEHALKLKVHRKPFFTLLPGSIDLNNVSLEWQGRLRVRSGSLAVRFPLTAIFHSNFPVSLNGQNLAVDFGPELSKTLGQEQVIFDRVSAKFLIGSAQRVDVEFLNAESKTIEFHLSRPAS